KPVYDQLRTKIGEAETSFQALPKPAAEEMARMTDRVSWADTNLAWTVQEHDTRPSPFLELVKWCLPVTLPQLDLLAQFSKSLQPIVSNLKKPSRPLAATEMELGTLDGGLAEARTAAAEA